MFMNLESITPVISKASRWLSIWSIVGFVCGVLAVLLPLTFSAAIAFIIGVLVLVAGIVHFVFAFHTSRIGGFFWQIVLGALYETAAIFLLANPLLSILSLTVMLATFLLAEGVLEIALYVRLRRLRHSLWLLFDGIGTLILGLVMARQWPPESPEIIGTLIGISLMLSALSRIIFSATVRTLSPVPTSRFGAESSFRKG
jgi:uncharacterized membrane protein HdeD (DUF308 family)